MQIRLSQFRKEEGCPQPGCNGSLHSHGQYLRYESPDGEDRFGVPRYCCRRCGATVSVLDESRLPYRAVKAEELEADFDRRTQSAPDPPGASQKKNGCLDRAWTAWNRSSRRIAALFGHLLERTALSNASQCWRALREARRIRKILLILGHSFKTSLLGDYLCLRPRSRRAAASL